nr:MAG TPA: hypothetical protein [Caudoviricetes sp.]
MALSVWENRKRFLLNVDTFRLGVRPGKELIIR